MNRNQLRISRALVVVVGLTLVVGIIVYARSKMKSAPSSAQAKEQVPAPTPVGHREEPATKPVREVTRPQYLVTSTPMAPPVSTPESAPPLATPPAAPPAAPPVAPPPAAPISGNVLAAAKAKLDGGDLVTARSMLNDALLARGLSEADTSAAKQMIGQISQQLVFAPRKFPEDPLAAIYKVQPGDKPLAIAAKYDITGAFFCRINGITERKMAAGASLKVIKGPFHAVVTKSKFTMDIYIGSPGDKGSMYVMTLPVGLGKNDSTPTGLWTVEPGKKLPNPKFWGAGDLPPMESGDPKNPLGKFWIGLVGTEGNAVGQQSYGVHGTIDPDSIGKQASLGCIRMRNEDVAVVFEMLVEGKSTVLVKD